MDVSLSDYIESGTEGTPLERMELIADDVDLLDQVAHREAVRKLREAVDRVLTDQERTVICLRYGLDGRNAMKQREVGEYTGISRSYISRIEKRALEKLRKALE
jgi:RNA polymerase sporulation-specific sigma factor